MKEQSYTERLNGIISVVSDVAMGDLSKQVEADGEDELTALAMSINEMISNLKRYRTEMAEQIISVVSDVAMGDLSKQVEVVGEDEIAALGMAINEMISGLKEKEFIRESFGKYISKQVLAELLNGKIKMGGERKEVTILFSDIRGFTTISESEEPEELVESLNNYFTRMVNVLLKYKGTVDKFIGDGILVIFGAPLFQKDHAQRAIDSALAMRGELILFNRERKKEGKQEIKIGIAINTGEVIVGNIGSDKKMEYTAVGDTVNVAARLEELNKELGTETLITHSTYAQATRKLNVIKLPTATTLRGRKKMIQCYELKGTTISD